ncbi:MAG: sugar ABC transporter ATP-binding protein [Giesbergeria sp.]
MPAVDGVDFTLNKGEVHALCGENGAGKSTLTKIMAGVVEPSEGELVLEGRRVQFRNPVEAQREGIAMVFQETSLVPTMTVGQNLYLGNEKLFNRLRAVYIASQQLLQSLNFNVDPTKTVSELGAAQKQMVEIARAVLHKARVIIFDEPTATLTPEEKRYFFDLIRNLKGNGVSIIFISHALEEALEISDRITIMRDSKLIVSDDTANFDRESIIRAMVGRDLSNTLYGKKESVRPAGKRVLSVQNLRMGTMVRNTSFSVFSGQITGVFGLIGSGRTETFKVVAGVIKRDYTHGGKVIFNDRPVRYRVPAPAVAEGIAYITEDRKVDGFFETMSISRNIYAGVLAKERLERFLTSNGEEKSIGQEWRQKLNIRSVTADANVIELSGGNQQKVVIAKSLIQNPKLVIFDEPTRGVDVGAVAEIHDIIRKLADEGLAVVVISSYLPEIMLLSDRILVSRQGRIVEEFNGLEATEEKIMYASIH